MVRSISIALQTLTNPIGQVVVKRELELVLGLLLPLLHLSQPLRWLGRRLPVKEIPASNCGATTFTEGANKDKKLGRRIQHAGILILEIAVVG
jgi:hypothetical protein